MALSIKTQIKINSTSEIIWKVFTDFESYPDWNPFIKSIKGEVEKGNKIEAKITTMTFKPTVLEMEEQKTLRWLGRMLMPGIFDGEHYFNIIEHQDGTSTFEQGEIFTGILVPLFRNKLNGETKDGFKAMNQKLKERVENLAT